MALFNTREIQMPDGETVLAKELSVGQLREADRRGTEDAVRLMAMLPETIVADEMRSTKERAVERIIRYEGYDPETLLKYGIVKWSYPEECTPENIAVLGAQRGEIIARAIFELSVLPEGEAASSSTPSLTEPAQDGRIARLASTKSADI